MMRSMTGVDQTGVDRTGVSSGEYEELKQLPVLKSTLVRYVYLKRDWSKFSHAQKPDIIQ